MFATIGGMGFWTLGRADGPAPQWILLVLGACLMMGLWSLFTGLFGSSKDADVLAEQSSSPHEASLIVIILAAPLYCLLKYLESRRR
jgi:hypothetical protein